MAEKPEKPKKPTRSRTAVTRTGEWVRKFLRALAMSGIVRTACAAANVHRDTVYHHRKTDPAFALKWRRALRDAADLLEQEARRRAYEGCKKPVYQQGARVGYVQEYSDRLMELMLKAAKPRKYRERQEVTGTVQHTHAVHAAMAPVMRDPEAFALAKQLRDRMAAASDPKPDGSAGPTTNDN